MMGTRNRSYLPIYKLSYMTDMLAVLRRALESLSVADGDAVD